MVGGGVMVGRPLPEGRLYFSERALWAACPAARPVLERLARYRDENRELRAKLERYRAVRL